jgi:hypothetical protein
VIPLHFEAEEGGKEGRREGRREGGREGGREGLIRVVLTSVRAVWRTR